MIYSFVTFQEVKVVPKIKNLIFKASPGKTFLKFFTMRPLMIFKIILFVLSLVFIVFMLKKFIKERRRKSSGKIRYANDLQLGLDLFNAFPSDTVPFEYRENRIRGIWLMAFAFTSFINWFFLIGSAFVEAIDSKKDLDDVVSLTIGMSTIFCFKQWIVFHCAYEKKGTKFLSFIIFMSYLNIARLIGSRNIDNIPLIELMIEIAIVLFFSICCMRLRKINLEARSRPKYIQEILASSS